MKDKHRYVYENWYVKSCEKSNETPIPFEVYRKRAPMELVDQLVIYLNEGMTP